ncbi:hypothetical protein GCM10023238_01910 [Streptomyces heliomycini]
MPLQRPRPASAVPAADAPLEPLLDWALCALASVGALTYGDGQATLTPLGSWAVWVKLEQDLRRRAEPRRGTSSRAPRDMLRGCAQLRPNAGPRRVPRLARRPAGRQRRHGADRRRPG